MPLAPRNEQIERRTTLAQMQRLAAFEAREPHIATAGDADRLAPGTFGRDQRSRFLLLAHTRHATEKARASERLDRLRVQHASAMASQFGRLAAGHAPQPARSLHELRIGRRNPADLLPTRRGACPGLRPTTSPLLSPPLACA